MICVFPNNLDGVFVGTHRAIGAQPVENRAHCLVCFGGKTWFHGQTRVGYIVLDTHREMVLR